MSFSEVSANNGFLDGEEKDPARLAFGSEYAKCQGLWHRGKANWLLRTPTGAGTGSVCAVVDDGWIWYVEEYATAVGIRPAMRLRSDVICPTEPQYNPTQNAEFNQKSAMTVSCKTQVVLTVTAAGVPEDFSVALYDGGKQLAIGDNQSVSYGAGAITENKTFTARIIDTSGNVQSNADGKLEKQIEITVKTGFLDKLKAFFLGLFGLLPKVELVL